MLDVRLMKKKNGKLVLQKYTGVGQNHWGHVVFGWVDVKTVKETEGDRQITEQVDASSQPGIVHKI